MATWMRQGAILAVLALAMAAVAVYLTTRSESVASDGGDATEVAGAYQERTGKALGLMLGLEPVAYSEVKGDCWAWAEYDTNHHGLCMDAVVSSKVEAAILGKQINGHHVSEAERKYIELTFELNEMMDYGTGTQAEIDELSNQLWEMKRALD